MEQDFKDIEEAAKDQQMEEIMDILDHVEKWVCHGYVNKKSGCIMATSDYDDLYGVVHRANEDFQMNESDLGEVMEARSFAVAMEKLKSIC